MTEKSQQDEHSGSPACSPRFQWWAGSGLPRGWALNMGFVGDDVGDIVWPIVDNEISGPIHGYPRPDQMLCWCPTLQKQEQVIDLLRKACGLNENDW